MSKKFSKSRVIIFSIILLILIGFAFIQNKNLITDQTVNNPLFLQYKGDISIDKKDKSLNLPFVFIDSTNSKLFNDLSDKIKSNNQYTSNDFLLFKDKTNNIEIYLKEADYIKKKDRHMLVWQDDENYYILFINDIETSRLEDKYNELIKIAESVR